MDIEEIIEKMLFAILQNDLSKWFLIILTFYFILALLIELFDVKNHRLKRISSIAPGAMMSLGILGTFLGIFIGLLDFDIININESVPQLLEGLKIAFGTSILGLTYAIAFRIINPIIVRSTTKAEDSSIDDIVDHLINVEVNIKEGFKNLYDAVTDEKDTSIVGQLQRLRASNSEVEIAIREGFKQQNKEFREFSENMSETFSKAIIDELKSVIREFNEKISEQFGENFKKLNEAVGLLVTWQEQYRNQMEEMKTAIDTSITGIETCRNALLDIEKSSQSIPGTVRKMEEANKLLADQIENLAGSLKAFSDIKESATEAFPVIEKHITNMTTNVEKITETMSKASEDMTVEVTKASLAMSESAEQIGKDINDFVRGAITEQQQSSAQMISDFQSSFREQVSNATSTLDSAF